MKNETFDAILYAISFNKSRRAKKAIRTMRYDIREEKDGMLLIDLIPSTKLQKKMVEYIVSMWDLVLMTLHQRMDDGKKPD